MGTEEVLTQTAATEKKLDVSTALLHFDGTFLSLGLIVDFREMALSRERLHNEFTLLIFNKEQRATVCEHDTLNNAHQAHKRKTTGAELKVYWKNSMKLLVWTNVGITANQ